MSFFIYSYVDVCDSQEIITLTPPWAPPELGNETLVNQLPSLCPFLLSSSLQNSFLAFVFEMQKIGGPSANVLAFQINQNYESDFKLDELWLCLSGLERIDIFLCFPVTMVHENSLWHSCNFVFWWWSSESPQFCGEWQRTKERKQETGIDTDRERWYIGN